jgi:hypothetical protein
MSQRTHSVRSHALRVLAIVLIVVGVVSVAGYGVGALSTMGDADQSMVFWLLPFLLGGLAMAGVGTVLLVLWLILVSSERSDRAP